MARLKRGTLTASTLMLVAVIVSGCGLPYSTPPAATNTPPKAGFFASPMAGTPGANGMSDVSRFMTETAIASSGTPLAIATQTDSTSGTPNASGTLTPTPLIALNPTSTATLAVGGSGTSSTSVPVGSRPASYTLQHGEFPYCIARRFDVDPDALLSLNGLSSGDFYYPNLTLKIPQSGSFPGARSLRNHPGTYTVASADETVYSVACLFGDVDPGAIAQANNISASAALTSGQQLNIP